MKPTLFIRTILSSLAAVACLAFSGNTAFAGIDLVYPGDQLPSGGDLIIKDSFSNNTILINAGGADLGDVYGAQADSNNVTQNAVTIKGGTIKYGVRGGYSMDGMASNNSVKISGGSIGFGVLGGYSYSSNVSVNSVEVTGGIIEGMVMGGQAQNGGNAEGNIANITENSIAKKSVYGGASSSGNAKGNTVNISGKSNIAEAVYGGYSTSGNAEGNIINISSGTIGKAVHGGYSQSGKATGNSVHISGGTISEIAYGGYSSSGNAEGNTLEITGGAFDKSVYGGFSVAGSATGNTLTISAGVIKQNAIGGEAKDGDASGNRVTISSGTIGTVHGGYTSGAGNAANNIVNITGGIFTPTGATISGGYAYSGNAEGNILHISGVTLNSDIWGGRSQGGSALNNSVQIDGDTFTTSENIYGGYAWDALPTGGNATGNAVIISAGTFDKSVYGGFSRAGSSENNMVLLSGGSVAKDIYGGCSNTKGNSTNNTIRISSGTVTGHSCGGLSIEGNANENTVEISGGTVTLNVMGGCSYSAHANGNTIKISGGTISGLVYGGCSFSSEEGHALNNTVQVTGGSIDDHVYGGFSMKGDVTNNTIKISGGSVTKDIYGGSTMEGNATNNTIILGSEAALSASSRIYGGFVDGDTGNSFTGNKLVLDNFHGTIAQIANFELIDITTSGKEEDMLVIAGGKNTDLSKAKVSITFTGLDRVSEVGDVLYLIRNEAGIVTGDMTFTQDGQQKIKKTAYIYDLKFETDQNSIHATVTSKKFNDRSKALAEGRVASMAHLNMAGDLIAEQGMTQALRSSSVKQVGQFNLFAAMAATASKYDTGSHIDLYGYSALAGAAITLPALTSLNCGLFAESGWGHYGSMSDFEDGAVRGSGDTEYYGGGLMTQYDFSKMGVNGLSAETSFRTGEADTSFTSGDLPGSHYDLTAPYYGIHAGVNYTRPLTKKLTMASYGRFFWTHMDGDNAPIDSSDFRFRTMDSQRIKAGARFLYEVCSCLTPYAGAAYEWECSGTARAVVDGENGMNAPSLGGGTGTGELGAIYQPMENHALWVDLSVQGHVGERQGVTGALKLRSEF